MHGNARVPSARQVSTLTNKLLYVWMEKKETGYNRLYKLSITVYNLWD